PLHFRNARSALLSRFFLLFLANLGSSNTITVSRRVKRQFHDKCGAMKRLPPIDVLRPGHAHENIVNHARIVSGLRWISDGPSSFECLSSVSAFAGALVRAREKAEKTLEANGADGISDIEGKATRVGASERGQRTSFNGGDGISDIEHVAIGNRADRRQR